MRIVFDDMMADIQADKNLSPAVTELFLRGTTLNTVLALISQSYFKGFKTLRLYEKRYFAMRISNKRELQQIALSHSSYTEFKNFLQLYKKFIIEPSSFFVNGTTLLSGNSLIFWKNLLQKGCQ